ncbi:hypothetical protein CG709_14360, partial [Lachnotalea glycerini]
MRMNHREKYQMLGGITGDNKKNIYVNDFLNNRICMIDEDGQVEELIHFGLTRYEELSGSFQTIKRCYGLFYHKDALYLTDTDSSKIIKMDLDTKHVKELPLNKYMLSRPIALTVDSSGNLFI